MRGFFSPASVAVVGASPRTRARDIMGNLLAGFSGPIYPVNPNHQEIMGLPCFQSLDSLPETPDLAILFVPAAAAPQSLEACARREVKAAMIQSAGFAETGIQGRELQDRCKRVASQAGMRLWGPNCMGMVDVINRRYFTFMKPDLFGGEEVRGGVSLVAQSGMLSAGFVADLMSRGMRGLAKVCSIGNKADVDELDLLSFLLEDEQTKVIAFYLEALSGGRRFIELTSVSYKPIVVLLGGRSEAGRMGVRRHTASITGEVAMERGLLREAGVSLARDFHHLMETAHGLEMMSPVCDPLRVALISWSGATGNLACDLLSDHGLMVADLEKETLNRLEEEFPAWAPPHNPLDLYPAIERLGRKRAYHMAASALLKDPRVDALLVHVLANPDPQKEDLDPEWLAENLPDGKVVVWWVLGLEGPARRLMSRLRDLGFAAFRELAGAVDSLGVSHGFHSGRGVDLLDGGHEEDWNCRLEEIGNHGWPSTWDDDECRNLLRWHQLPLVEERLVKDYSDAERAANDWGYPVVLKGLMRGEVNNSEHDLVAQSLRSPGQLATAMKKMEQSCEGVDRWVLRPQVITDYDLMVSYSRTRRLGGCLTLGRGGAQGRIDGDRIHSLAHLDLDALGEILGRLRCAPFIKGMAGFPALDLKLFHDLLQGIYGLMESISELQEIELNPVAVVDGSPLILEASLVVGELSAARA